MSDEAHSSTDDALPTEATRLERHRAVEVDAAQELGTQLYYPQNLWVLGDPSALDMHVTALHLEGGLTVGRLRYGVDVRIDCGELGDFYEVNIPLTGVVDSVCGDQSISASPARAAVFNPAGRTSLERWSEDCTLLGVKIARSAIDAAFEALSGRRPRRPLRFDLDMPLGTVEARRWMRTIDVLLDELEEPGGLPSRKAYHQELISVIASGLILLHRHDQADALETLSQCVSTPATVRRAADAVAADPGGSWTVAELADVAGVPVRTLQHSFHRHFGESPREYIQRVRLESARLLLLDADPTRTTVAAIAHRVGIGHLGRFSALYRQRFAELPSASLQFLPE